MSFFSLLLAIGTLAGLGWVALRPPQWNAILHVRAGAWALVGALIGGRSVHVAVHWSYYQAHPTEIPQVWLGGLSGPGALLGGLAGLWVFALLVGPRTSPGGFARLADALVPLVAAMGAAAWLACWWEGVAYGAAYSEAGASYDPTAHPWFALHTPDEWGNSLPRVPLQPAAALLTIAAAWLAETLARDLVNRLAAHRAPGFYTHTGQFHKTMEIPGLSAALGLFLLALAWLPVSLLRADPVPVWRGQPLDLWFNLGLAVISGSAVAGLILSHRTGRKRKMIEPLRREEAKGH